MVKNYEMSACQSNRIIWKWRLMCQTVRFFAILRFLFLTDEINLDWKSENSSSKLISIEDWPASPSQVCKLFSNGQTGHTLVIGLLAIQSSKMISETCDNRDNFENCSKCDNYDSGDSYDNCNNCDNCEIRKFLFPTKWQNKTDFLISETSCVWLQVLEIRITRYVKVPPVTANS